MKRVIIIAAFATAAAIAHAEQAPSSTTTASSTTTVAAASGQSSTVIPDPETLATAKKAWSLSLVNQTSLSAGDINYVNNSKKSYEALSYAGLAYKLNEKSRVGLRQYITMNHDGPTGADKTTLNDTVLTYSRTGVSGILNSDNLAPLFWYYAPTSSTSRSAKSYGQVRLDLEIPWTLNPQWSVSYYLNPRQNFIPEGELMGPDGKPTPVFSKTTLIHYGYLYRSFSDSVTAYTYGGLMHRWKTSSAKLTDEELLLGLGMNFTLLGGKITLMPEISVASVRVKGAQKTAAEQIIQEKNVSYVMTSAFVF